MLYFIPWVVFLLVVILAVPVTAWLEKRKLQQASGPAKSETEEDFEPTAEGETESGEAVAAEETDEGFGESEGADGEIPEPEGGDDFSAFDEEIK